MPWVLVDPASAVCSQVCKTEDDLRDAIQRWSVDPDGDGELNTEPFYNDLIRSHLETLLDLIDNKATMTEINTYLCRMAGTEVGLRYPSATFENRVRALVSDSTLPHEEALKDWILVAYENTGREDLGYSHICPPRLAVRTALNLIVSP